MTTKDIEFRDAYIQCLIDAQYDQITLLSGQTREEVGDINLDVLIPLILQDLTAAILRWLEIRKEETDGSNNLNMPRIMARLCAMLAPDDMLANPDTMLEDISNTTDLAEALTTRAVRMLKKASE